MAKKTKKKKKLKKAAKKSEPPQVTPYPTAGAKITEFEDLLDQQLSAGDEQKRGPGRPPKEPEPEPGQFDYKIVQQAIEMPFDLWSISQGVPELKLRSAESVLIAKPVKELLDYYLPQVPVVAWAWISVAIATYSAMRPRLELIQQLKKQKSPAATAGQGAQKGVGEGAPIPPFGSQQFPSEIITERV